MRAVLALEVHELHEGEPGVLRSADVIHLGVHRRVERHREIRRLLSPPTGRDLEDRPAQNSGEHHRHEHAQRRLAPQIRGGVESEADDQQRHGETDARKCCPAEHAAHSDPLRQSACAHPDGEERRDPDSEELAEHEPRDDAPRHRRAQRVGHHPAAQVDSGIGQSEDRHDQQRRGETEVFVQPLVDRHALGQPPSDGTRRGSARGLPEVTEQLPGGDHLLPLRRVGGDQKAGDHARQRGVDAGGQSRQPQHDDDPHVRSGTPLPGTAHQPQGDEAAESEQQRDGSDLVAVEHPDDRHRKEVVDHREGQEEDAKLPGKPGADDRESTEHERRVRSDDRPPPAKPLATGRADDQDVHQRRHRHSRDARDRRQAGATAVPQSPVCELLAHLEAHDEEEHDHQSVVDPVVQIQMQAERTDVDPHALLPQLDIGRGQRRVRPEESEGRDDDEQHGRARLRAESSGYSARG